MLYTLFTKIRASKVYENGLNGRDKFYQAQDQLIVQDFDGASESLNDAINSFTIASDEFEKFRWLSIIPFAGSQVKALDNLLKAGISTGESIAKVNSLAKDIITPLQVDEDISISDLSEKQTTKFLEDISNAKPDLENAKNAIDQAVAYVEKIPDRGLIKKIKEVTDPLKEKVP